MTVTPPVPASTTMARLQLFAESLVLDEQGVATRLRPWYAALLGYLALASESGVNRSVVAGMLWPDSAESVSGGRLRQLLFRIRNELGPVVQSDRGALRLDSEIVTVDVRLFHDLLGRKRWADGVDLYGGDFLAGLLVPDSAPFQQWVELQRAKLHDLACSTYEHLARGAAASGDWDVALRWAEGWHALAPRSEAAVAECISVLAQRGDRGRALALFERFQGRLREDLDVSPGDALQSLIDRIRSSSSTGVPPSPEISPSPDEYPLVGRTAEFSMLSIRWEHARSGQRQFVLLSGEPGIGKSRLAHEFLAWAKLAGATVLEGRAYEVEQGVPYAPLAGALRGALDAPGLAAVDSASLHVVGAILPQLHARFPQLNDAVAIDMESGRIRLLEGLRAIIDNLAYEAPVVLFIDDLPWADEASLAALHYLWRTLPDAPLLMIATARSEDLLPESPAGQLIATLRRADSAKIEQVELPPLGRTEIEYLIQASGLSPAEMDAARLQQETGGNPLFMVELLRSGRNSTPPQQGLELIQAVVRDRTARLSPAAMSLLSAAAVLGRRFPLPSAIAIAELSPGTSVDAVDELLHQRLVLQVEYGYDFAHDLLRQSVYAEMGDERRRLLHQRALERLLPPAGEQVGLERAGALATHARLGGLPQDAYRWALRAASLAEQVYAGSEAERYLEQASDFAKSGAEYQEAWERIGDLRRAQSRFSEAARAYLHTLQNGGPLEPLARLRRRTKLLDVSLRSGLLEIGSAEELLEDLFADAQSAGATHMRELHSVAADTYTRTADLQKARGHARAALDAARLIDDPSTLVWTLLTHGQLEAAGESPLHGVPFLEEAVAIADHAGLSRELDAARIGLGVELCRAGQWLKAHLQWRAVVRGESSSSQVHTLAAVAVASINLADLAIRQGDWIEAASNLSRAGEFSDRFDWPHLRLDVLFNRALLAWYTGEIGPAVAGAADAAAIANRLGIAAVERVARALLALGGMSEGKIGEAADEMKALERLSGVRHVLWRDDQELIALAGACWARISGDAAQAEKLLQWALVGTTAPYSQALLQLEWSEVVGEEEPVRARRLAEAAITVFQRLRAAPMLQRAREQVPRLPTT